MFPITCVVKYSIYFVTDGKYPFISDEPTNRSYNIAKMRERRSPINRNNYENAKVINIDVSDVYKTFEIHECMNFSLFQS